METVASVSYKTAAQRIRKSRRTIVRLVRNQTLKTVGSGQARRVTIESIEEYLKTHGDDISGQTNAMRAPFRFTVSSVLDYQKSVMRKRIREVKPLNSLSEVASQLGLSSDEVEKLLKNKSIPTVSIGSSVFIPQYWLAK